MTPAEQRHHAIGILSRIWTLWMALTEPERLTHKEAIMTKPWLCRIGRHRWQRLRPPKAAGTTNAAAAEANAAPPERIPTPLARLDLAQSAPLRPAAVDRFSSSPCPGCGSCLIGGCG